MRVWISIDPDKYERVNAVADTARELAEILGIKVNTIYVNRAKARRGERKLLYMPIDIPDDDDEQDLIMAAVDLGNDYNCKVPSEDWLAYQVIHAQKEGDNGKCN